MSEKERDMTTNIETLKVLCGISSEEIGLVEFPIDCKYARRMFIFKINKGEGVLCWEKLPRGTKDALCCSGVDVPVGSLKFETVGLCHIRIIGRANSHWSNICHLCTNMGIGKLFISNMDNFGTVKIDETTVPENLSEEIPIWKWYQDQWGRGYYDK